MSRKLTIIALTISVAMLARAAFAQESAEALRQKRHELQARVSQIDQQIQQIRSALAKQQELADAQKALDAARKAYDQKLAGSAKLAEARKAADNAAKAARDVLAVDLGADPHAINLSKIAITKADAVHQLHADQRAIESAISQIRKRIAADTALKPAADAVSKADAELNDPAKLDAKVADAKKTIADARKALDEKIKTLPEYQALANAQKNYDEAVKGSSAIASAKQARDDARRKLDEQVQAKLGTDAEGAAQLKKLAELGQKAKDAQDAASAAEAKLAEARARVSKSSAKYEEARKARVAAEATYRQTTADETKAEKAALDETMKGYNQRLEAKASADPKVIDLKKQVEVLQKLIDTVREQEKTAKK